MSARTKRPKLADDKKIRVLVKENPKRKGTAGAKRFALYRSGMTVAAALKAGVTRADLNWDTEHKFIEIK